MVKGVVTKGQRCTALVYPFLLWFSQENIYVLQDTEPALWSKILSGILPWSMVKAMYPVRGQSTTG